MNLSSRSNRLSFLSNGKQGKNVERLPTAGHDSFRFLGHHFRDEAVRRRDEELSWLGDHLDVARWGKVPLDCEANDFTVLEGRNSQKSIKSKKLNHSYL